jgi:phosphotransacetylase
MISKSTSLAVLLVEGGTASVEVTGTIPDAAHFFSSTTSVMKQLNSNFIRGKLVLFDYFCYENISKNIFS